jgi:hypothetical protein
MHNSEIIKYLSDEVITPTVEELRLAGDTQPYDQIVYWLMLAKLHLVFSGDKAQVTDLLVEKLFVESPMWKKLPDPISTSLHSGLTLKTPTTKQSLNLAAAATCLSRTQSMVDKFGLDFWPICDALNYSKARIQRAPQWIDETIVESLFDALDAEKGDTVWVPFDYTGQISTEALKRNLLPLRATLSGLSGSIHTANVNSARLALACASKGFLENHLAYLNLPEPPASLVKYGVVCPPIGFRVSEPNFRLQLGGSKGFPLEYNHFLSGKFTRLEAAVIPASLSHISERCIFLTSQGVLFGAGEEQRMREMMFFSGNSPSSVMAIPAGAFADTAINTSILVFDNIEQKTKNITFSSVKAKGDFGLLKTYNWHAKTAAAPDTAATAGSPGISSVVVEKSQLQPPDFSWQPGRYSALLGRPDVARVALGEVFDIIRSAPYAKADDIGDPVHEIGIPELGSFRRITGENSKFTVLNKRTNQFYLEENDIILSVKGSVGKSGVFGGGDLTERAVCSPACVGLRHRNRNLLSTYAFFVYLQSEDFKAQVEGLSSGALISSLTLANLKQIKIPQYIFEANKASELSGILSKLQALEKSRIEIEAEMKEILENQVQI